MTAPRVRHSISNHAEQLIEAFALARKRATIKHDKARSLALISAYDELAEYIAKLEADNALYAALPTAPR
jgi:hypothetical protein